MLSFAELKKRSSVDNDGEKISITDVLGKDIVVLGYELRPSIKHEGDYLMLKIEHRGNKHVIFTSSCVLRKQCERYRYDFPFIAKILKRDNYFTFA